MKFTKAVLLTYGLLPLFAGAATLFPSSYWYENDVFRNQPQSPALIGSKDYSGNLVSGSPAQHFTVNPPAGYALDRWVMLKEVPISGGVILPASKLGPEILKEYSGYSITVTWDGRFAGASNLFLLPCLSWLRYTLYYDKNDGTVSHVKSGEYVYTNDVVIAGCPFSRTGYDFAGWTLAPEGGSTTNFPGDVVTGAGEKFGATTNGVVNLYAQWKPIEYDVTFSWRGGRGVTNETRKVTYGEKPVAPPLDVIDGNTGHTFAGWDPDTNAVITAERTFTAQYRANTYRIVFDANGGEGRMDAETMTYGEAAALNTCMFTREGCTFLGWALSAEATEARFEDGKSVKDLTSEPDGEVRLYAVWKLPETRFDVVFAYRGADGAPLAVTNSVDYGRDATPPEDADGWIGHRLAGWDGDCTNITAAVELHALYTPNAYKVRFDANGGEGEMADQDFLYDQPEALAANAFVRATAAETRGFLGWALTADGEAAFGDCETVSNLTSAADGIVELHAVWGGSVPTVFPVAFNYRDAGGLAVAVTNEVAYGTDATPPPDAVVDAWAGHRFAGWDGDYSNVTAAVEVTARYEELPPEPPKPDYGELSRAAEADFALAAEDANGVWSVDAETFVFGDSAIRFTGVGTSSLTGTVHGAGTLTFAWRADFAACDRFDYGVPRVSLITEIAGYSTARPERPGTNEWTTVSYTFDNPDVDIRLIWRAFYFDDHRVWLDHVSWTPAGAGPTEEDAPELAGFGPSPEGGFTLSVRASDPRFDYRLLGSVTLAPADWRPVGSMSGTGGPLRFEIPADGVRPQMFYKVEVLGK